MVMRFIIMAEGINLVLAAPRFTHIALPTSNKI